MDKLKCLHFSKPAEAKERPLMGLVPERRVLSFFYLILFGSECGLWLCLMPLQAATEERRAQTQKRQSCFLLSLMHLGYDTKLKVNGGDQA